MPEGDTLYHYARRLRPLIVGQTVLHVDGRYPGRMRGLEGQQVLSVDSVGKHLMIAFDDDTFLRVHLGMKGSIHRYAPAERWQRPFETMGWMLQFESHTIVGFYPKALERIRRQDVKTHPVLSRLGPDLLQDPLDLDEVVARFRHMVSPLEAIGVGLLDQRPACGIGNIYRCETLFAARCSPFDSAQSVPNDALRKLYEIARDFLRANVADDVVAPRTTPPAAKRPLAVYECQRLECLRCQTPIATENQADLTREYVRLLWFCPRCQAPRPPAS